MRKLASDLSTRFRLWRVKSGPIPEQEIVSFGEEVAAHSWCLNPRELAAFYRKWNLEVIPDYCAPEIAHHISKALSAGLPLSVVRIGDGEANVLRCRYESVTRSLDRRVARKSILKQSDHFIADDHWLQKMGARMEDSIREADIVGVLGLWPDTGAGPSVDNFVSKLEKNRRGAAGSWYGRHELCGMAQKGLLTGKIITSAHLYFGLVAQMRGLIDAADRILCMTDKEAVVKKIEDIAGGKEVLHIPVGTQRQDRSPPDHPDFLAATEALLPQDLSGSLVLIGAGLWAEFYAGAVKRRGGVGVDIGSGFDLMAGQKTRSIHQHIPEDVLEKITNWGVSKH